MANPEGSGIPIMPHIPGKGPAPASSTFMMMITDLVAFGGFPAVATGPL